MSAPFGIDLPAITAFVSVGDTGGFRAAAATLGMTSAAVSKAVSRLEARLGVALVARTTRSVRLTSAGSAFHARCKAFLADLDRAAREAADGAALPQGRLVIGVSRVFGRMRVVPVVADFVTLYPQVEVEVRLSDRPVDLVAEGVDLAVRIGHLPDSNLTATRISRTGYVLCGSPDYLAARGVPAHPDDLHRHDVVGYVAPDTAVRFTYDFLVDGVARTLSLPSRLTMDDGEALVGAAMRSVGLVMVNDYVVEQHIAQGSLVRVLRAFEMPPVPISAVQPSTRHPSQAARALLALLRRHLAGVP
jgi:LysR family transcriptional regulator, regulator for bpeEF and oprC